MRSAAIAFVLAALSQPAAASIVAENEPNDTLATAQNLDPNFDLGNDPNITNSTTMPHSSIRAASSDVESFDVYSFTVAAAGTAGIFDIDQSQGGSDLWLSLFDSVGNLIGSDDDSALDPGSTSTLDPFLVYVFGSAGTYYVRVEDFASPYETNQSYILHASLDSSAVPEPATWAMMLLGFGAAGMALRRRRSSRLSTEAA